MALAAVMSLSACGDDDAPQPAHTYAIPTPGPTSSTPVTSGPSATPTPGPVPAAARADSEAGAKAFVRFYFDRLNMAVRYPEGAWLQGLATANCRFCRSNDDVQADLRRRHLHVRADVFSVPGIEPLPFSTRVDRAFQITVIEKGAVIVNAQGNVTKREPDDGEWAEILVTRRAGAWLVDDFREIKPS
ncbi:hypothetical protein [Angustibacter aerolatus]|nr:hypothetical protein [Angustibacter aerolatus]